MTHYGPVFRRLGQRFAVVEIATASGVWVDRGHFPLRADASGAATRCPPKLMFTYHQPIKKRKNASGSAPKRRQYKATVTG